MKKIITITMFLLLTGVASYCQQIPQQGQQISNHDLAMQYLNKSKSQKKTSTILLVSGLGLTLAGTIVSLSSLNNGFESGHPDKGGSGDIGDALGVSGICILAAGIPFAFIAKHNKKKAELLLQNNQALPATSFTQGRIYSIGIRVSL